MDEFRSAGPGDTSDVEKRSYRPFGHHRAKLSPRTGVFVPKQPVIDGLKLTASRAGMNPCSVLDVEVILDVSARVRQQREIESALKASARMDALTGLPNRAAFDEFLADAVDRNLKNDRKLALAFIDLNKFKTVNDALGHSAGGEVLRIVASRLRDSFRATDFIARIGGDEFVIMLDMDRRIAGDLQSHLKETMERVFKPIPIGGELTFTGAAGRGHVPAGRRHGAVLCRACGRIYVHRQEHRGSRCRRVFRPDPR
ncbi:GGDEF domain-containing protein [Rhizobium sp. OAE497]|uniref:GGDEF domain-containing protein n=1 Tax=Rhizobium sp. OAE497 TaxID=2663796 RepID=UPI0018F65A9B